MGIILLSQVIFLYYSAWQFHQILHRNDNNSTVVEANSNSKSEYLSQVIKWLVVVATGTLVCGLLAFSYSFVNTNPIGFLLVESGSGISLFISLASILRILTLRKNKNIQLEKSTKSMLSTQGSNAGIDKEESQSVGK